jgi:hypothetical protein
VNVSQTVLELHSGDEISISFSSSGPSLGMIYIHPDKEPACTSLSFTLLKIDIS